MDTKKKSAGAMSLKKAVAFLTIGKLQGAVLLFIGRGLAARIIGPEVMGAFVTSTTALTVVSRMFSFGLGPSAQYNSASGKYKPGAVLSGVLIFIVFVSLVCTLLIWLGRDLAKAFFFGENIPAYNTFNNLLPLLVTLFMMLGLNMFLLGMDKHKEYNRISVLPSFFFLAGVGISMALGWGYRGVLAAQIVMWVSGAVMALLYSFRIAGKLAIPDRAIVKQLFSYGLRASIVSSFTYALNRAAILAGNHFVTPDQLGQYAVATQVGESIVQLYGMSGALLLVRVSRADSVSDGINVTCFASRATLIILSIFSLLIAVSSPIFLPLVFGREFTDSVTMLIILIPGILAHTQHHLLENYLYGRDKQQLALVPYLATAMTLALTIPSLAAKYGGKGLALSTSLGYFSALLTCCFIVKKIDGIKIMELWAIRRADILYLYKTLRTIMR